MKEDIDAVIREFESLKAKDQGILRDVLRSDASNYPYIDELSERGNEWLRTTVQNEELHQIKSILNISTSKNSRSKSLINSAIVIILVGSGNLFVASNVTCLIGTCFMGKGVLTNEGISISNSTAQLVQSAPPYILGLGGILLLAGLLKSE